MREAGNDFVDRLGDVADYIGDGRLLPQTVTRLTAGASQETWRFAVQSNDGPRSMVLRRMPSAANSLGEAVGPEAEASVIAMAAKAGVPVPAIRHVLTPSDGLGRGFVSDHVDGETIPRRILRDDRLASMRARLAFECGGIIAGIHSVQIDALPSLPIRSAPEKLDHLRERYEALDHRRPVFEAAFRWLTDRCPTNAGSPVLVHGDFRNGNLIVGDEGVRAVLDWELTHLGDPAEDLGWITVNSWRFGMIDQAVGGFGSIDDLLAGYRAAGGGSVTLDDIRFWRVAGSLSWGIGAQEMALAPADGVGLTVERAMIGRRVSETELDLLDDILEATS